MYSMNRIILFLMTMILPLQALEVKRVILSTNNNPLYIEFWPVVAPLWKAMGFKPTLALVANSDCPIDTSIGDVIRFDPIPGIPESLQAQVIRLFLPILFPDEGCMISDIDMIPISPSYFREGSVNCPDHAFLVYRNKAPGYAGGGKYPMCYLAGKGNVFRSIFGISTYEQIPGLIKTFAAAGQGWYTDELMIYAYAKQWEKKGGKIVLLNHDVGPRLDRIRWDLDFKTLDVTKYIDCHCPRPYSQNKETIDPIVAAIYQSLIKSASPANPYSIR